MWELYGPPQFHSQNREYFGVFGPVDFWQTVDKKVVIEREKGAFRDMESDSCGTSASRPLSLRFLLCAGERLSSAKRLKSAQCGLAKVAGIGKMEWMVEVCAHPSFPR
jgi:hypothetical protein